MKSGIKDTFDRRVVPRWRDSSAAVETKTMHPLKPKTGELDYSDTLASITEELTRTPTTAVAVDALNFATMTKNLALASNARAIIRADHALPETLRQRFLNIGLSDLDSVSKSLTIGKRSEAGIQRIRRLLKIYPRNPLLFLDLARHHVILGHHEKAMRAAQSSLALQPNHRYILRSVARCYLSSGDDDGGVLAHRLLINASATPHDPWLISAELAIAQESGRKPRFWREAKRMLEQRSHLPANLSELASAVGTLEALDGSSRRARDAFTLSNLAPTDNSLAQIKWAENRMSRSFSTDQWIDLYKSAHEAQMMQAYRDNNVEAAALHAQNWYYDEPFSIDAAVNASYVCSMLDDYNAVNSMCETALIAHPGNLLLENNLLFARISSGQFFDDSGADFESKFNSTIQQLVDWASSNSPHSPHAAANLGLIAYRAGHTEEGRAAYDFAIKTARQQDDLFQAANAAIFHVREAILAKAPWSFTVLSETQELLKVVRSAGLDFYMTKLTALAANPERAEDILSPANTHAAHAKREISPAIPNFPVIKDEHGRLTIVLPKKK